MGIIVALYWHFCLQVSVYYLNCINFVSGVMEKSRAFVHLAFVC